MSCIPLALPQTRIQLMNFYQMKACSEVQKDKISTFHEITQLLNVPSLTNTYHDNVQDEPFPIGNDLKVRKLKGAYYDPYLHVLLSGNL